MSDLVYPKNGGAFLLQRIHDMHATTADLIDELVKRDQQIADLNAKLAKANAPLEVTGLMLNAGGAVIAEDRKSAESPLPPPAEVARWVYEAMHIAEQAVSAPDGHNP